MRREVPQGSTDSGRSRGSAWFAGLGATSLSRAASDPRVLEEGGWWAVVITFEGEYRLWRFEHVVPSPAPGPANADAWTGPARHDWLSSLDEAAYVRGVGDVRRRVRAGDVYQVNLCRVLTAPISPAADPWALARRLAVGNPAPHAGVVDVPAVGGVPATRIVSASPELFLGRDGDRLSSGPIKGTATTASRLRPKDVAENVMIVDLMRNDLHRVSRPGTVAVPSLLRVERHPGLVHLVSTVESRLRPGTSWADILKATMPPGSVSGAPKSSALRVIRELEPVPRGPYCGAIGFVDADRGRARLAVGIRTFWWDDGLLRFGAGAGITWDSDPRAEWEETELKAARLLGLASPEPAGTGPAPGAQVRSRATAASRSR